MNITELYYDVDDFCPIFLPVWQNSLLTSSCRKRQRTFTMSPAEVMTVLISYAGYGLTRKPACLKCSSNANAT